MAWPTLTAKPSWRSLPEVDRIDAVGRALDRAVVIAAGKERCQQSGKILIADSAL